MRFPTFRDFRRISIGPALPLGSWSRSKPATAKLSMPRPRNSASASAQSAPGFGSTPAMDSRLSDISPNRDALPASPMTKCRGSSQLCGTNPPTSSGSSSPSGRCKLSGQGSSTSSKSSCPCRRCAGSCDASASPRSALSSGPASRTPARCGLGSQQPAPPPPACAGAGIAAALGRRGRQDLALPPGHSRGLPGPDACRPAHGGAVPAAQAVREQSLGGNPLQDPCRNCHRSHVGTVPAADSGPDGG